MDELSNRLCECDWPKKAIGNDWFPVTYDENVGEFQLILDCGERKKGSAILRFCPWCGGAFPDSNRGNLFATPTDEDMDNVHEVMSSIKTVDEMQQCLGKADETFESEDRNQYVYKNRWKSLELVVFEFRPGISWVVHGQEKLARD